MSRIYGCDAFSWSTPIRRVAMMDILGSIYLYPSATLMTLLSHPIVMIIFIIIMNLFCYRYMAWMLGGGSIVFDCIETILQLEVISSTQNSRTESKSRFKYISYKPSRTTEFETARKQLHIRLLFVYKTLEGKSDENPISGSLKFYKILSFNVGCLPS